MEVCTENPAIHSLIICEILLLLIQSEVLFADSLQESKERKRKIAKDTRNRERARGHETNWTTRSENREQTPPEEDLKRFAGSSPGAII